MPRRIAVSSFSRGHRVHLGFGVLRVVDEEAQRPATHRGRQVGEAFDDVEVGQQAGRRRLPSVRLHTAALVVVVLPKELPPKNGL